MTIDYYLSMGSLITGILTDSPVLKAVPTAFRFTATVFPKLFPLGISKIFTPQEREKLDKIKTLLDPIRKNLAIPSTVKFNLRVSQQLGANAAMIGTTSSIGGPLLCLGESYFKNYEAMPSTDNTDLREWLKILNEKSYSSWTEDQKLRAKELEAKFDHISILKDPEFREWLALLEEIPNTPQELGKFIDACTPEKRNRIAHLVKKFKNVLTQEELESILAHELGHAKHHHLLKSSGLMLSFFLAYGITQLFANSIGLGTVYNYAAIPLAWLTIDAITRMHETEADGECAHTARYQKGMLQWNKKELIHELFQEATFSSFESKVAEMLQSHDVRSNHPNHAKRLHHAIALINHPHHPQTRMTRTAWILAGIGAIRLANMCYSDTLSILK